MTISTPHASGPPTVSKASGSSSAASSTSPSSSSGPSDSPFINSILSTLRQWSTRLQGTVVANRSTLQWSVPLTLVVLYLLRRRLITTRERLFRERSAEFWNGTKYYAPPAQSLPHPLTPTHMIHAFLPLSVQHFIRDRGLFRLMADGGTYLGGLLLFGWKLNDLRRMFAPTEGRIYSLAYGSETRQTLDVMFTHRVRMEKQQRQQQQATATVSSVTSIVTPSVTSSSTVASSLPLSPILIFMHGGAWGSGSKEIYRLLAQQLEEQLQMVTFCFNYSVWPIGDVNAQMDDLHRVIEYAHQRGRTWGGDPNRIFLIGHSSGAHCISLYIMRQLSTHGRLHFPIAGVIGLAGPYDIADHYEFESARGVHEGSPMKAANGGIHNFPACSATRLALQLTREQRQHVPPFLLLHGHNDGTVPGASSIKFAYALAGHDTNNDRASDEKDNTTLRPVPIEQLPSHERYHGTTESPHLTSFTFPLDTRDSLPIPLIQVRMVGSSTDPSQCDHASFIFDILHTRRVKKAESPTSSSSSSTDPSQCDHASFIFDILHTRRVKKAESPTSSSSSSASSSSSVVVVGHTRWVMESIQYFIAQIEAINQRRHIQQQTKQVEQVTPNREESNTILPTTTTTTTTIPLQAKL